MKGSLKSSLYYLSIYKLWKYLLFAHRISHFPVSLFHIINYYQYSLPPNEYYIRNYFQQELAKRQSNIPGFAFTEYLNYLFFNLNINYLFEPRGCDGGGESGSVAGVALWRHAPSGGHRCRHSLVQRPSAAGHLHVSCP